MKIPVAEWLPDLSDDKGAETALNVIPDVDSYRPWQGLENYSGSLSAQRAQGAVVAIDNTRNVYNYAGTGNDLRRMVSLSWVRANNVTLSATFSYSTSTDQWWEFAQWNNTVIATNGFDPVQEISLGGSNFRDLPGAPPVAYHVGIVRDFIWLGNISGSPQRIRWSAINNSQSWTVDAATQADFQDLPGDGGHVQRVIGGNVATVFQEHSIWRAHYIGSPAIFDFGNGPIEPSVGLLSPQSAVKYGPVIFFLDEGGFRVLSGQGSEQIGRNKIDRTFFNDLDAQYAYRVQAIIDPTDKLYICCYPGAGNVGGNPNKIMIYNWSIQRWSLVAEDLQMLFRHISTGYTLEGLDGVGLLDDLQDSLDSAIWAGGQINLGAFTTGQILALFTGNPKTVTVDTQEVEHFEGRRSRIARVRPLVEDFTASVTPLRRNILSEGKTAGTPTAQNTNGDCTIRSNARYHSYRITGTPTTVAGHIRGVDVLEVSEGGAR